MVAETGNKSVGCSSQQFVGCVCLCQRSCTTCTAELPTLSAKFSPLTPKVRIFAAEYFDDRTDVQCLHRWQKVLNPELVKGPWTKEVR